MSTAPRLLPMSGRGGDFIAATLGVIGRGTASLALRVRPDAASRPPWERSIVDDVAMRRPWNLLVKAARRRALWRRRPRTEGVTVVIVNWNTWDVTADVIAAVQNTTPPTVRVLVVDNGSSDGSREALRSRRDVDTLLLPSNAGHGVAIDIALTVVPTRIAVLLDSDAIPLGPGWLEPVVEPLRSGRTVLAGLRARRGFVHPAFLAIDTETFVRRRLSFQVHRQPGVPDEQVEWGVNAWDTAELMSPRLDPALIAFVEPTAARLDGLPGMMCGGVVYHHGGVSRAVQGGVSEDALEGWRRACESLGISGLPWQQTRSSPRASSS
jgi:Glycosyl transferase family 2